MAESIISILLGFPMNAGYPYLAGELGSSFDRPKITTNFRKVLVALMALTNLKGNHPKMNNI